MQSYIPVFNNIIHVKGKRQDILMLKRILINELNNTTHFDILCPAPKDLENHELFSWCLENWGTRLEGFDSYIHDPDLLLGKEVKGEKISLQQDMEQIFCFRTYDNYPKQMYLKLLEKFGDTLNFRFEFNCQTEDIAGSMDHGGCVSIHNFDDKPDDDSSSGDLERNICF